MQLHGQAIAHQDLKPSNVLRFPDGNLKLGDLGRSSLRGKQAPHDNMAVPGALNYAPFDLQYGQLPSDWVERRLSTDVFHLGCLTVFTFTNICFPTFVMGQLAEPHRPANWGAPYDQVIPHIQVAMIQALQAISDDFPDRFRDDLISIVRDLCHPDPALRGQSGARGSAPVGQLWLQRYVSKFDILEKTARVRLSVKNV